MRNLFRMTLFAGVGSAMCASSAMAAFTFVNGDLVMGFQATGGVGADKNVFVNLGSGVYHRDNVGGNDPFGTSSTVIANVNATLVSAFGASWYSRTDVYFGVIGNLNNQPNSGVGSRPAVSGDPSRTMYWSSATTVAQAGQLVAASTYSSSALGAIGGTFGGMEGILGTLPSQADNSILLVQGDNPTEWNNSWTVRNPTPGAAFGAITGGIQQNLGKVGTATYVDLQRLLSTNTGASPTGVIGGGTYETTFAVGSDGSIFAVPEPSTSLLIVGAAAVLGLRRRRN